MRTGLKSETWWPLELLIYPIESKYEIIFVAKAKWNPDIKKNLFDVYSIYKYNVLTHCVFICNMNKKEKKSESYNNWVGELH